MCNILNYAPDAAANVLFPKRLIIIEIRNPRTPNIPIPIAETFAVSSNSFFVGFFKTCQTLLHFRKNDFAFSNIILSE